jgi:hypothetical protein
MKSKVLLRDIPSGMFHSAVCTSYSLNLYYLEQQVLPLLASKGVHYVSILVDGNMLSSQLGAYSILSESRRRNYALHGVHSNGAFHPKLIFLAGDKSVLLLIGSGNLTSCGHGRNLESWNAVYVTDPADAKLELVLEAWNFIKSLYAGLGISAENALRTIEGNCGLFSATSTSQNGIPCPNDETGGTISFMATVKTTSLLSQLTKRIGGQSVKAIHIMSPYYDQKGQLIHLLQEIFKPKRINVVLQEKFGMPPHQMDPLPCVRFFLWQDARSENFRQSFFHAKHIIIEGLESNLMYSGSANASIAAFGRENFPGQNVEAGILYEASGFDFAELLGIQFNKPTDLQDIAIPDALPQSDCDFQTLAYIRAIEKENDSLTVYIVTDSPLNVAQLFVFTANGTVALTETVELKKGESKLIAGVKSIGLLYAELRVAGRRISNKQFIIDIAAFEATNPSPQNRSLNQIRKLIEGGSFSSHKIIEYLNTIHREQLNDKTVQAAAGNVTVEKEKWYKENQELMYLSYAEIQKRIREMKNTGNVKNLTTYKTVRLWESIFSYLKEARIRREESLIDEEETEDINSSTGRIIEPRRTGRKTISKSNFNRLNEKVEKFMNEYAAVLKGNVRNSEAVKPTLVDLTMYLIVLEVLLHLFSHKEHLDGEAEPEPLFDLEFSDKFSSWSDFLTHIVGSFTLWCAQKDGIKLDGNEEYRSKVSAYLEMAYKTTIGAVSIFSLINKKYDAAKIEKWKILNLKNSSRWFDLNRQHYIDTEEFMFFIPDETKEELGVENLKEELSANLYITLSDLDEEKWFEHPEDGLTYIEKRIPDNPDVKFYKLIHPGYEWHDSLKDQWNGEFFSPHTWRWIKSLW